MGCANSTLQAVSEETNGATHFPALDGSTPGSSTSPPASGSSAAGPSPHWQEVGADGLPPSPASTPLEAGTEARQKAEPPSSPQGPGGLAAAYGPAAPRSPEIAAATAAVSTAPKAIQGSKVAVFTDEQQPSEQAAEAAAPAPEPQPAVQGAAANGLEESCTPALANGRAALPASLAGADPCFDRDDKSFIGAPLLAVDAARCEATASLYPGGSPAAAENEPRFDAITKLVSAIFNMPLAMVVFIDNEYSHVKSAAGMETVSAKRHMSFCTWTLVSVNPEMLVVHDALKDGRFRPHPYVAGEPHIRFYAGAPLVTSTGHRLGTLCLVDFVPREFDAECCSILANFAGMVVRDAERYAALDSRVQRSISLAAENDQLIRAIDKSAEAYILCSPHEPGWPMLFVNDSWGSATDMDVTTDTGKRFWDCFEVRGAAGSTDEAAIPWAAHEEAVARGNSFVIQVLRKGAAGGRAQLYTVVFRPAAIEKLDRNMANINIPAITKKASDQNPQSYYFGCIRQITSRSSDSLQDAMQDEGSCPFDDVILGALLGKGSFGNVYFGAWQLPTGEEVEVAVKLIEHKNTAMEKDAMEKELEASLGLQLDHPNVVHTYKYTTRQIHGSWDSMSAYKSETASITNGSRIPPGPKGSSIMNGSILSGSTAIGLSTESTCRYETWIVLELCSLGSLQGAIDGGAFRTSGSVYDGLPDLHTILLIAAEIARAMEYLHSKNVLHGDLTANNILLVETPETELLTFSAKVSDFGLSRVMPTETAIKTNTCGTVTHMPPELITEGKMSKAVDVYGFGVLLWELYVGERPFAGMRPVQIVMRKSQGTAWLKFPPGTPPGFKALAELCMAPSPGSRPTFSVVLEELSTLLQAEEAGIVEPHEAFAVYQDWSACGGPASAECPQHFGPQEV